VNSVIVSEEEESEMKARKWNETILKLSRRAYEVPRVNSISLAERLSVVGSKNRYYQKNGLLSGHRDSLIYIVEK